jgi:hypothetical protein
MRTDTQILIDSASNLCNGYASVDRAVNPLGVVDVVSAATQPLLVVHTKTLFGKLIYAHLRKLTRGGQFQVEILPL